MSDPIVSVLMPVFNCGPYLRPAVESIISQSFVDFELIIVDDGSTDGSLRIATDIAIGDDRVKVIEQSNGGIVSALNHGLAHCRGVYIARMDGDDIATPERLQKQLDFMNIHPKAVAVGSHVTMICPLGLKFGTITPPIEHNGIEEGFLFRTGDGIVHPTAFIRADALRQVGGYREKYCFVEDLDLFLRLAMIGELHNIPESLLLYRRHPACTNVVRWEQQRERVRECLQEAYSARNRTLGDIKDNVWVPDVPSLLRFWAQSAIDQGRVGIALRHAVHSLRLNPVSRRGWQVLFKSLLSPLTSIGRSRP